MSSSSADQLPADNLHPQDPRHIPNLPTGSPLERFQAVTKLYREKPHLVMPDTVVRIVDRIFTGLPTDKHLIRRDSTGHFTKSSQIVERYYDLVAVLNKHANIRARLGDMRRQHPKRLN
ncbi:TPA: hypothetical protein DEP96_03805 [Candidatus Uhrbacteria bacterium]|nr:hypothetical protein [Candidatus Uhrbacteria bacterium]